MPINFPNNPTEGDTYNIGNKPYVYNGYAWVLQTSNTVSITTSTVSEGTNLYFTNARVYSNVTQLNYASKASPSFTGTVSLLGNTNSFSYFAERANIISTGMSANVSYNIGDGVVHYHTANASANSTVNLVGLNGVNVGNAVAMAVLVTNGATAFKVNSVQVDGTTSNVTVRWAGGKAPVSGYSTNIDVYSFNVIKTNTNAYTVLVSQNNFGV